MILILKLFIKEEKLLFFITNLRAFCIHFLQILPSEFEGNTLRFRGKNSIFFRQSFFPRYALGMPSFNNSVPCSLVHHQTRTVFTCSLIGVCKWRNKRNKKKMNWKKKIMNFGALIETKKKKVGLARVHWNHNIYIRQYYRY